MSATKNPRYDKALADARAGRDGLNAAHINALGAAIIDQIEVHISQIALLEGRIARVGELLRISQPPGYSKYDIRWWSTARNGKRVPTLVRWQQAPQSKKYVVKEVQRYRKNLNSVRSDGTFAVCVEETHELVMTFLELSKRYRSVLSRMELLRGAQEEIMSAAQTVLDESNADLDTLQLKIVAKLLDAGYSVEKKYRE